MILGGTVDLVTGAGQGVGRGVALALAAEGSLARHRPRRGVPRSTGPDSRE
jgi:NAD(P)-dependent dehydrogenase (short-subunit alcohol dehydrogenase family)